MKPPKHFEYIDINICLVSKPRIPTFVTILDEFKHHYSGKMMYYIRKESMGSFGDYPCVDYETIDEVQLRALLDKANEVKEREE